MEDSSGPIDSSTIPGGMAIINGGDGGINLDGPSSLVGVGPPSPLTGCYLMIVIGEPYSDEHKDIIIQRLIKGFLSWNLSECQVDLEEELNTITLHAPEGEEARHGERLIQYASENLVTEILIHPQYNTLIQCMRNLLSSFTRHRHIIHAGYTFSGNGSWILQDGTFSVSDFSEAFQENDVQRVLRAYPDTITMDIHCEAAGLWTALPEKSFTKSCKIRINPVDVLNAGSQKINAFIDYLAPMVIPASLNELLETSDVVGNIRFSHPTLYVFPGGQGDAALFGINGFNMLVDGGFARKACFWDFTRHLDRLDAVLMTRISNCNINGLSSVVERKAGSHVYPQIGHFFCNIPERKGTYTPEGEKDKDPLLVDLFEKGHHMVNDLRSQNLRPENCYKDSEPINLYHKVGHGTLDMYVLSPSKDAKEVKEFLQKWNANDPKLFTPKDTKEFTFPIQNLVSICALLVWQPANPDDSITRILFPGSTPDYKIMEGLEKIKHLEFMKHPVCSTKVISQSMSSSTIAGKKSIKSAPIIEKPDLILPSKGPIKQAEKDNKMLDNKLNGEDIKAVKKISDPGKIAPIKSKKIDNKIAENEKVESTKEESEKKDEPEIKDDNEKKVELDKKEEEKVEEEESKPEVPPPKKDETDGKVKPKVEAKVKAKPEVKSTIRSRIDSKPPRSMDKRSPPKKEDKKDRASPTTTPKKMATAPAKDTKEKEVRKVVSRVTRSSPSGTPAKSAKDANNRKVLESKKTSAQTVAAKKDAIKPPTEKKEPAKVERKPISRRPKTESPSRRPIGSPVKSARPARTKAEKDKKKTEKDGTTDSSLVSTPSADDTAIVKKIIGGGGGLHTSQIVASADDLKEEQEAVREIEAIFNRDEAKKVESIPGIRDVIDVSKQDSTAEEDEEYLIIEKEEVEQYTEDSINEQESITKEEEIQKHQRDSQESEKKRKGSVEDTEDEEKKDTVKLIEKDDEKDGHSEKKDDRDEMQPDSIEEEKKQTITKEQIKEEVQEIITSAKEIAKSRTEAHDELKVDHEEISSPSPEDKISSAKKTSDTKDEEPHDQPKDIMEQNQPESHPDEKFSATIESGATTAPTLPEDERIPLDEIKEDLVVEEKYVKEKTKEVDVKISAIPPTVFEPLERVIPTQIKFAAQQSHLRDIVKTPDEVADLPVHEEADYVGYDEYKKEGDSGRKSTESKEYKVDDKKELTPDEKVTDKKDEAIEEKKEIAKEEAFQKIDAKKLDKQKVEEKPIDETEVLKHLESQIICDFGEKKEDPIKKIKSKTPVESLSPIPPEELEAMVAEHDKIVPTKIEAIAMDTIIPQVTGDKVTSIIEDTKDKIDSTVKTSDDTIDDVKTTAKDTIDNIATQIEKEVKDIDKKVCDTKEVVKDEIVKAVEEMGQKLDEKKTELGKTADDKLKELDGKLDEKVVEITGKVDEKLKDGAEMVEKKVIELNEGIGKLDDQIKETIGKFDDKINAKTNEFDENIKETIGKANEKIDTTVKQVDQKIKDTIDKVETTTKEIDEKIKQTKDKVETEITKAKGEIQEKAKSGISSFFGGISQGFKSGIDKLTEKIDEKIKDTSESVDNLIKGTDKSSEKTSEPKEEEHKAPTTEPVDEKPFEAYDFSKKVVGFPTELRETHITTLDSPIKETDRVSELKTLEKLPEQTEEESEESGKTGMTFVIEDVKFNTPNDTNLNDIKEEEEEDRITPPAKIDDHLDRPRSISPRERTPEDVIKIVTNVAEVLKSDKDIEEIIPDFDAEELEKKLSARASPVKCIGEHYRDEHEHVDTEAHDEHGNEKPAVQRMLVTASSEDGGEETEICPQGSIKFVASGATTPDVRSGRLSPESDVEEDDKLDKEIEDTMKSKSPVAEDIISKVDETKMDTLEKEKPKKMDAQEELSSDASPADQPCIGENESESVIDIPPASSQEEKSGDLKEIKVEEIKPLLHKDASPVEPKSNVDETKDEIKDIIDISTTVKDTSEDKKSNELPKNTDENEKFEISIKLVGVEFDVEQKMVEQQDSSLESSTSIKSIPDECKEKSLSSSGKSTPEHKTSEISIDEKEKHELPEKAQKDISKSPSPNKDDFITKSITTMAPGASSSEARKESVDHMIEIDSRRESGAITNSLSEKDYTKEESSICIDDRETSIASHASDKSIEDIKDEVEKSHKLDLHEKDETDILDGLDKEFSPQNDVVDARKIPEDESMDHSKSGEKEQKFVDPVKTVPDPKEEDNLKPTESSDEKDSHAVADKGIDTVDRVGAKEPIPSSIDSQTSDIKESIKSESKPPSQPQSRPESVASHISDEKHASDIQTEEHKIEDKIDSKSTSQAGSQPTSKPASRPESVASNILDDKHSPGIKIEENRTEDHKIEEKIASTSVSQAGSQPPSKPASRPESVASSILDDKHASDTKADESKTEDQKIEEKVDSQSASQVGSQPPSKPTSRPESVASNILDDKHSPDMTVDDIKTEDHEIEEKVYSKSASQAGSQPPSKPASRPESVASNVLDDKHESDTKVDESKSEDHKIGERIHSKTPSQAGSPPPSKPASRPESVASNILDDKHSPDIKVDDIKTEDHKTEDKIDSKSSSQTESQPPSKPASRPESVASNILDNKHSSAMNADESKTEDHNIDSKSASQAGSKPASRPESVASSVLDDNHAPDIKADESKIEEHKIEDVIASTTASQAGSQPPSKPASRPESVASNILDDKHSLAIKVDDIKTEDHKIEDKIDSKSASQAGSQPSSKPASRPESVASNILDGKLSEDMKVDEFKIEDQKIDSKSPSQAGSQPASRPESVAGSVLDNKHAQDMKADEIKTGDHEIEEKIVSTTTSQVGSQPASKPASRPESVASSVLDDKHASDIKADESKTEDHKIEEKVASTTASQAGSQPQSKPASRPESVASNILDGKHSPDMIIDETKTEDHKIEDKIDSKSPSQAGSKPASRPESVASSVLDDKLGSDMKADEIKSKDHKIEEGTHSKTPSQAGSPPPSKPASRPESVASNILDDKHSQDTKIDDRKTENQKMEDKIEPKSASPAGSKPASRPESVASSVLDDKHASDMKADESKTEDHKIEEKVASTTASQAGSQPPSKPASRPESVASSILDDKHAPDIKVDEIKTDDHEIADKIDSKSASQAGSKPASRPESVADSVLNDKTTPDMKTVDNKTEDHKIEEKVSSTTASQAGSQPPSKPASRPESVASNYLDDKHSPDTKIDGSKTEDHKIEEKIASTTVSQAGSQPPSKPASRPESVASNILDDKHSIDMKVDEIKIEENKIEDKIDSTTASQAGSKPASRPESVASRVLDDKHALEMKSDESKTEEQKIEDIIASTTASQTGSQPPSKPASRPESVASNILDDKLSPDMKVDETKIEDHKIEDKIESKSPSQAGSKPVSRPESVAGSVSDDKHATDLKADESINEDYKIEEKVVSTTASQVGSQPPSKPASRPESAASNILDGKHSPDLKVGGSRIEDHKLEDIIDSKSPSQAGSKPASRPESVADSVLSDKHAPDMKIDENKTASTTASLAGSQPASKPASRPESVSGNILDGKRSPDIKIDESKFEDHKTDSKSPSQAGSKPASRPESVTSNILDDKSAPDMLADNSKIENEKTDSKSISQPGSQPQSKPPSRPESAAESRRESAVSQKSDGIHSDSKPQSRSGSIIDSTLNEIHSDSVIIEKLTETKNQKLESIQDSLIDSKIELESVVSSRPASVASHISESKPSIATSSRRESSVSEKGDEKQPSRPDSAASHQLDIQSDSRRESAISPRSDESHPELRDLSRPDSAASHILEDKLSLDSKLADSRRESTTSHKSEDKIDSQAESKHSSRRDSPSSHHIDESIENLLDSKLVLISGTKADDKSDHLNDHKVDKLSEESENKSTSPSDSKVESRPESVTGLQNDKENKIENKDESKPSSRPDSSLSLHSTEKSNDFNILDKSSGEKEVESRRDSSTSHTNEQILSTSEKSPLHDKQMSRPDSAASMVSDKHEIQDIIKSREPSRPTSQSSSLLEEHDDHEELITSSSKALIKETRSKSVASIMTSSMYKDKDSLSHMSALDEIQEYSKDDSDMFSKYSGSSKNSLADEYERKISLKSSPVEKVEQEKKKDIITESIEKSTEMILSAITNVTEGTHSVLDQIWGTHDDHEDTKIEEKTSEKLSPEKLGDVSPESQSADSQILDPKGAGSLVESTVATVTTIITSEIATSSKAPAPLVNLSGKVTPDLEEFEHTKDSLGGGRKTPPTVPVSPNIKGEFIISHHGHDTGIMSPKDLSGKSSPGLVHTLSSESTSKSISVGQGSGVETSESSPKPTSPFPKGIQSIKSEDATKTSSGMSTPDMTRMSTPDMMESKILDKSDPGSDSATTVTTKTMIETELIQHTKSDDVHKTSSSIVQPAISSIKSEFRSNTPGSDDYDVHDVSSPRSEIGSEQVSRGVTGWTPASSEERHFSDDEGPGSPLSTTSQAAHSPPSKFAYDDSYDLQRSSSGVSKKSDLEIDDSQDDMPPQYGSEELRSAISISSTYRADPMATSFYGALPDMGKSEPIPISGGAKTMIKTHLEYLPSGPDSFTDSFTARITGDSHKFLDEADLDFEKALEEHRQVRGADVMSSITSKYDYSPSKTKSADHKEENGKAFMLDDVQKTSSKDDDTTTPSSSATAKPQETQPPVLSKEKEDMLASWGKPLGLPAPAPVPIDNNTTPKRERRMVINSKTKLNNEKNLRKRSESPVKGKKPGPIYMDLTYVPHHGNSYYSHVEFFKRVRARYYVFSGTEPSREVYNALLEAKQTWEDKDLEVTIIPTYDTDVLGYWVSENEDLLAKYHIDLSPSASRCTINLQDHETSCSAYRLEF